jgi:hypothetical protein
LLKSVLIAASAAALIIGATAQSPAPRKMPMQLRLAAQNNSAEQGTATLLDGTNGLIVRLRLAGAAEGVDQPAHIHQGTCDKLDPKPKYGLKSVHDGQSETTVPGITIAQLQKPGAPYAINVHKSAKEAAIYVSCGNLTAPK